MGIDAVGYYRRLEYPMAGGIFCLLLGLLYIRHFIAADLIIGIGVIACILCVLHIINVIFDLYIADNITERLFDFSWSVMLLCLGCSLLGFIEYILEVSLVFLAVWYFGVYRTY